MLTRKEIERHQRYPERGEGTPIFHKLCETALALYQENERLKEDTKYVGGWMDRVHELEIALGLANEEIRHAYSDNETHRRRIAELETTLNNYRNVAYLAGLKKAVEVIKESAGDPDVLRYSIEAIEAVIAKGGVDAAHRR